MHSEPADLMPQRRTSNRMKVLKGTDTPSRMRDEPEFPVVDGYPEAPDWLIDPVAVDEWEHKSKLLTDAGVLTEASLTVLAHYCNMHAKAVQQWRIGSEPTGADKTQLRLMATEFGFTPASASKVGGGKKGESNDFKELVG